MMAVSNGGRAVANGCFLSSKSAATGIIAAIALIYTGVFGFLPD
ncbi:hypothetical protein [Uruburuella suis]|nr:hypothetical protein [Uruburuella suis]